MTKTTETEPPPGCRAATTTGKPCRRPLLPGQSLCGLHQKDAAAAATEKALEAAVAKALELEAAASAAGDVRKNRNEKPGGRRAPRASRARPAKDLEAAGQAEPAPEPTPRARKPRPPRETAEARPGKRTNTPGNARKAPATKPKAGKATNATPDVIDRATALADRARRALLEATTDHFDEPGSYLAAEASLDRRRGLVLAELRAGRKVLAACAAAGVGVSTAYDWRAADLDFARDWNEALRLGRVTRSELLEDAIFARAVNGWLEPVYHNGKEVGTRRRFNDDVGLRLLRALAPERFNRGAGDLGPDGKAAARRRITFVRGERKA